MKTLIAAGLALTVPASLAMGELIFYDNQADFEAAMAEAGKTLKFTETFEENVGDPQSVFTLDPILTSGVPNGPFLNGLDAPNLTISTEGATELVLLTENFLSNPSDVVGPNTFTENGVITFDTPDKTGIGMELWVLANNPGSMQIDVYDTSGDLIGREVIATPGAMTYFGVQSTVDAIGSIITIDPTGGSAGELYDNIAMYTIPSPGALALLGLAGLTVRRRRRVR